MPSSSAINRLQSHMASNRIVILSPKGSERSKLELNLGDVGTKDELPYPRVSRSRGGQIIRASTGSLVRKLSLASFTHHFRDSRGSCRSPLENHTMLLLKAGEAGPKSLYQCLKSAKKALTSGHLARRSRIGNNGTKRLSFSPRDNNPARTAKSQKSGQESIAEGGPDDTAEMFNGEEKEVAEKQESVETLVGRKK
ncbi:uncharacterized protein Z518_01944 [Rhinocladiella mackenziei CBS 650.93]|uniref:Uncharacterized protein n=1 Tax=Rhinocladiella mackenziei CBS 650.93 TaxID=1442369 RepID=A0A0D2IVQ4_9EURO|nr:uncharacterized protein Z518_01944 [Rhinocladiella mackenziei CBS 650.93]KIX07291.1 hypothetical protein Z518_01944 [Rhinocladiella mackenziei CBS 650.93]